MQKSGIWPLARIHSSTRTVPSTAGPSSSPVINRLIEPSGGPSARCRAAAATKAAMAPFMSQAPRPYSTPLRTSAANGSDCQFALPAGTTSVWPAKQRCGDPVPMRANRLSISPKRNGVTAKPSCRAPRPARSARRHPQASPRRSGSAPGPAGRGSSRSVTDQSRSNSLIEVFARVCSSTVLTITAQYSDGPGDPSGKARPAASPAPPPNRAAPARYRSRRSRDRSPWSRPR